MPTEEKRQKPWEDPKLWKLVYNRYKSGIKYREGRSLSEMWDKFEQYYDNEYWNNLDRADHLTAASDNYLFESVETMLPVITSRPPRPEITPIPKNLDEDSIGKANDYAKQIQRECVSIWQSTKMMNKIRSGFREHGIKGTFMFRSLYDLKTEKFQNTVCDILSIVPNPSAFSMEDCYKTWFCYAPVVSVEEVHKRFGVWVDAESEDEADLGQYIGMLKKGVRGVQKVLNHTFGGDSHDKRSGFVVLIEQWMSDDSMEDYEDYEYNADGTRIPIDGSKEYEATGNGKEQVEIEGSEKYKMKTNKRRKYEHGRVVTIVRNKKDLIMSEKPNGYGPRFPFFRTVNYERAGDFYGISEGKNIEDQNLMANQSISNINDNIRFTANPQKEIMRSAKVKGNSDEPGATYESDTGNGVRNIPTGQMPSYAITWPDWLQASADRKDGMTDAMRGISESGDSGIKTQALIAQATGRLQPKTAAFVEFSREFYEHCTYIIQHYYPESVIQQDIDSAGEPTYEEFRARDGAEIELRVDVSQISMLPFDNYAEFEEAQALYAIQNPKTGLPSISLEQLIDTAPAIRNKQRIKAYNSDEEEKVEVAQMLEDIAAQSQDPEAATIAIVELMNSNPEKADTIAKMAGIKLPEVEQTPEQQEEEVAL